MANKELKLLKRKKTAKKTRIKKEMTEMRRRMAMTNKLRLESLLMARAMKAQEPVKMKAVRRKPAGKRREAMMLM